MSAAINAAGYLYASGRLRARSKSAEEPEKREIPVPAKPRPAPRIEYRTRRWKPA